MRTDGTHWFRYEDVRYASSLDEFDRSSRVEVVLRRYRVVKTTPCGVWLDIGRFVKIAARKRFACPTEAEALESFLARKRRQLSILRAQARGVEDALARAPRTPQPADLSAPTP